MLYDAYQAQQDFFAPIRAGAGLLKAAFSDTTLGPAANYMFRSFAAGAEIVARSHLIHDRPPYGIDQVLVSGSPVAVREEVALNLPFGNLVHFRKEGVQDQPRVLLAAPMAGHFPTLLRGTAQTLLADHDVYITDWKSGRDVPLALGRFGTDEYIDHLIAFFAHIGPGAHGVAVCQPCPSMLAATALMAEDSHTATPKSLVLMAGPVDTSINPTRVNTLANEHPVEWFERNLITTVPRRYAGAHRRVYPGFLQLSAFMTMNLSRHVRAHMDLFGHILKGELARADANRKFYDEYFSVADLPAEFYLDTVGKVFQEHHLARGIYTYRNRKVDPRAIRKTSLLTVEGERDDICGLGQTLAAQDLCPNIKPFRKKHYVQAGAGHYGVFSGTRWQTLIYPVVRNTILVSE
ncbi:MAG TPA: polyhydroxyalkanoate depolymerase [Rhizomicrobium sp.]|nr:polyhydroxyalkanoate depolymerase [Rhizomicrobium sp.]